MFRRAIVLSLLTAGFCRCGFSQDVAVPAAGQAAGAENAVVDEAKATVPRDLTDSQTTDSADFVPLATSKFEIPLAAIPGLMNSIRQLDLNTKQKPVVDKFYSANMDRRHAINDIRLAVSMSTHPRLDRAIADEQQLIELNASKAIVACLSEEQKSLLRRKHRGAILQAVQSAKTQQASQFQMSSFMNVATPLANNDLLTAVQILVYQDKMEFDDERFAIVEQIAMDAENDSRRLVRECVDESLRKKPSAATNAAKTSAAMEKLQNDMDRILTADQQRKYQKHFRDQQEAAHKLMATDPQKAQQLLFSVRPHGVVSESMTQTGQNSARVKLKLTNYFASEAVAKELGIATEQQTQLSESLRECEAELTKEMEAAATERQKQENGRHEFVRQMINEHFQKTNEKIRSILSEPQLAVIQKERFRGLGIASLKEPEIQVALKLTDEQKQQIDSILSQKPEGIRNDVFQPVAFSTTDSFEKRSADMRKRHEEMVKVQEENSRKYQEHFQTQRTELWKVLSEPQLKTLHEMTGLETPTVPTVQAKQI